jgi:hypothetical protein
MSTLLREQEEIPHHSPPRDYLLVCDLPQRVRAFRLAGLNVPEINDDCFLAIHEEMSQRFADLLPVGTQLRVIDMSELAESILERAMKIVSDLDHGYIVSTCMEIAQPAHGMTLEVNRLTDVDGKIIGIGARPGYPDLDIQVQAVLSAASGRQLVFIEDGTFTGGTICSIFNRFRKRGASVSGLVLGFAFPESLDRLYASVPRDQVHLIEEVNQPVDWVPDHDFFPCIPNCGRVLGVPFNGSVYPFYGFNGTSYSIPYLVSYCPMGEWTGLTAAKPIELLQLTDFFLRSTIKVFEQLEKLNGKKIKFDDLRHVRPRVSFPFCIGQNGFPLPDDWSVITYLQDILATAD